MPYNAAIIDENGEDQGPVDMHFLPSCIAIDRWNNPALKAFQYCRTVSFEGGKTYVT